jgi:thioredoxin reductase (NADPH)
MKGINFCSVCDGPLFRGKHATLAVVGSDNAAAQHALTLSRVADKVFLICRSPSLIMDAVHQDLTTNQENIEVLKETELTGYVGLDCVEALSVKSAAGESRDIAVDGVFLAIGWEPSTDMLEMAVEKTPEGYLRANDRLMTSIPGLFAAGDVRHKNLYQVLTACSDGARAAKYASEFLQK